MICYSGMCCALNTEKSLQNSTYSRLVEEMQGNGEKRKVPLYVGKREGLTLILDLHSNRASLGTVARNSDNFNIFIGKVFQSTTELSLVFFFFFKSFNISSLFVACHCPKKNQPVATKNIQTQPGLSFSPKNFFLFFLQCQVLNAFPLSPIEQLIELHSCVLYIKVTVQ